MGTPITIQVSERVIDQAARIAEQSHQMIEDVLADWLERIITEMPVESLPDEEVLALTKLQLTAKQQATLSDLLARHRENILSPKEQRQLEDLMQHYEHGLLRKAQALRVAVQRGLCEPLRP